MRMKPLLQKKGKKVKNKRKNMEETKKRNFLRKRRNRYNLRKFALRNDIRICYTKSNKYIALQIVDNNNGNTIFSINTSNNKYFSAVKNRKNLSCATKLGEITAIYMQENIYFKKDLNTKKIYFDRGAFQYHGIAQACANSLRKNGVKF